MTDKAVLRAEILKRRERLSIIERAELSARVCERVLAMPEYQRAQSVLCYYSDLSEVDTSALIRQMMADGKDVYLPVAHGGGKMDAVYLSALNALAPGRFGIMEPTSGRVADPRDLSLIVVPGVAFDRKGGRLGRGGGYYDRYLAECQTFTVGLGYEFQLVREIPASALDVRLDRVATERATYPRAEQEGR